jgi:hypothetical protein
MEENKQGFFSKLKHFFKGEDKPVVSEEYKEEVKEEVTQETKPIIKFEECFWCKGNIFEGDHYSKQQGRVFHRVCYKKFLQAGKRGKI